MRILLLYFTVYLVIIYSQTNETIPNISCDESVNGTLNSWSDIALYYFQLYGFRPVSIDTCGSSIDTTLTLYKLSIINSTNTSIEEISYNNIHPDCLVFGSKLNFSLLPYGDYILQISGYGTDFGHFTATINCPPTFKIINSTATTLATAQLECEKTWGTSLATLTTQQDLNVLINTLTDITDINIWIGGYNNILNGGKWNWIAPFRLSVSEKHKREPYVCHENCINQNEVERMINIAKPEQINICNWTAITVCNAPRSEEQHLDTKMAIDFQFDEQQVGPAIAVWNSTMFILGKNVIHYTLIGIHNSSWYHETYNYNPKCVAKLNTNYQYKSFLYF
eukprot:358816_1